MATKRSPGAFDCYAAAEEDEPMFILLARDPLAPSLVRSWAAARRCRTGPSEKATEADAVADAMERWRREHRP